MFENNKKDESIRKLLDQHKGDRNRAYSQSAKKPEDPTKLPDITKMTLERPVSRGKVNSQSQILHKDKFISKQQKIYLQTTPIVSNMNSMKCHQILEEDESINTNTLNISFKQQTEPKEEAKRIDSQYNSKFFDDLRNFNNIKWQDLNHNYLQQKEFLKVSSLNIERLKLLKRMHEQFIKTEINIQSREDIKLINSLLLDESIKMFQDQEGCIKQLLNFIPEMQFLNEQIEIQSLFNIVIKMYDPKELPMQRQDTQELYQKNLEQKIRIYNNSQSIISKSYIQIIQEIIATYKTFEEFEHGLIGKVRVLQEEILKLKKIIEEYHKKEERDIVEMAKWSPIQVPTKESILVGIDQTIEKIYLEEIRELTQRRDECEEMKDQLSTKLKQKDKQIKTQMEQIELLKIKPQTSDADTQINLIIVPNKPILKKNPFAQFTTDYISPFTFSKNCTAAIIQLIFQEKLLYDYSSFQRKKQPREIVQFTCQWFLKTFGNKIIGQTFLKNFVQSLDEYQGISRRFFLFTQFCGIEDQSKKSKKISFFQDIKIHYMCSPQALVLFNKIAFVYKQKSQESTAPLFPNYLVAQSKDIQNQGDSNDSPNQVPIKKANQVIEYLICDHLQLIDASFQDKVLQLHTNFDIFAKQVLQNQRKKEDNLLVQRDVGVIKIVNLDIIAAFVLDYVGEIYAEQISRFFIDLKLGQVERINGIMSIDEFERIFQSAFTQIKEKPKEYIEDCFVTFYMTNAATASFGNDEQRKLALREFVKQIFCDKSYTTQFYLQQIIGPEYNKFLKNKQYNKTGKKTTQIDTNIEVPKEYIRDVSYDIPASISVLEECYDNIKLLVRSEEAKDERIKMENENFKLLLSRIPREPPKTDGQKLETIELCENTWKTLRKLLEYINSKITGE